MMLLFTFGSCVPQLPHGPCVQQFSSLCWLNSKDDMVPALKEFITELGGETSRNET